MQATIITIGDEILIGQTLDTNSKWIARKLTEIGIKVHEIVSVSDERKHIISSLESAGKHSSLILITGGLGPTKDDITKSSLAEFFNCELKHNREVFDHLKELLQNRGVELLESNIEQAKLPDACIPIVNNRGTAPGMWFESNGKVFISMPGVPHEMQGLMSETLFAKIKDKFRLPVIFIKHILTASLPEAILSKKLNSFEEALPGHIKLAYLPSLAAVKLRLTARGSDLESLKRDTEFQAEKIEKLISKYIYGYDDETLEGNLGKLLLKYGKTIGTAESCTGGYIAHRITKIPGSSAYFQGSIISYSNAVKKSMLGVAEQTLEEQGAVSEQTVREMVKGAVSSLKVDFAIAVSGIAGPSGGTAEKPVGTVWMAVGSDEQIKTKKFLLTKKREMNIEISAVLALDMMRRFLLGFV